MRILFVADAASIHTRRWMEYFRDRGDEVHVASFRAFELPGVTLHFLPTFNLGKLGYFYALLALPKIFRIVRPDIVHAHYLTSYGFLAAYAGLRPLVVTAWGSDVLITARKSRVMRYFAGYAIRHSNVVTTLADHMNIAVAELGIPLEKVRATPFGVNTDLFKLYSDTIEERQSLKLICTRNFDTIYDVKTLICALGIVFARGRSLQVDLIGDGPQRQDMVQLVRQLKLDSQVKFHGHLEHKAMASLLARADIFVTPALSDGNNVSLNEAMACGCFPIATDIPANSQWITHDINGYLYPPADIECLANLICSALDNSRLRSSARFENRLIAERRASWRICVERMEAIYQEIIEKNLHE
jgi:glycosyltransferase involved in cell wall biosynthesis